MADPAPPVIIPDPPPPVPSPTGTPLVSAKLVPYFSAGFAVATVIAGAAQIPGLHLPQEVFGYATLAALIFAALLGLTPGARKVVPVVLLMLGIGLTSCATTSAAAEVNVAAQSLDTTGKLFLATGATLDAAYDAKLLSEPQYAPWRDFSLRFKAAYAIADKAIEAAVNSHDEGVQGVMQAEVEMLARELATFQALAAQVAKPPSSRLTFDDVRRFAHLVPAAGGGPL